MNMNMNIKKNHTKTLVVEKSTAEKLIVSVKRKVNGITLINIRIKSVKNKSPRTFRKNTPGK